MTFGAIFDLDGTLIDTYDAHVAAWQRMGERHGVPVTLEQFARHFGRRNHQMIEEIWLEAGRPPLDAREIDRLGEEKESIYRALVHAHLPLMEGGPELIAALDESGWSIAIGSSAPIGNVDLAIERLGTRTRLDAVVTGNDVTRGKPDPECFLTAATRMGVAPNRCVVIEDAPAGIAAALAAGMRCVAITSKGHDPRSQTAAHLVVRSLTELTPERLATLVKA
ncbi:MAG: HAD family phosphatase [Phycisphaerales bacterium]